MSRLGGVTPVVRWAWYSMLVNVVLLVVHGTIAAASGSLAIMAELAHNVVDLAAAAILLVGLKIAMRKNRDFPYGLYKVENLVAAMLAISIFITAYEVGKVVLLGTTQPPDAEWWMLAGLVVTLALPLAFSHFELRVGRAANSPALIADAREYRVHAYTTGLAFAALLSARLGFPLDRVAALLIVVAVAKTGWELLADALRVLLDASLDARTLEEIRSMVARDPAVVEVKWIVGRNAGRFLFVEAGAVLRLTELEKAEAAVHRIESGVRASLPQIERVLLHLEPPTTTRLLCAVPLADMTGTVSEHFGEAPYFAFLWVNRENGSVEEQQVQANPFLAEHRAKGLRVAEWLTARKVDRVMTNKSLNGRGPAYVLREAGIELAQADGATLAQLAARGK